MFKIYNLQHTIIISTVIYPQYVKKQTKITIPNLDLRPILRNFINLTFEKFSQSENKRAEMLNFFQFLSLWLSKHTLWYLLPMSGDQNQIRDDGLFHTEQDGNSLALYI